MIKLKEFKALWSVSYRMGKKRRVEGAGKSPVAAGGVGVAAKKKKEDPNSSLNSGNLKAPGLIYFYWVWICSSKGWCRICS